MIHSVQRISCIPIHFLDVTVAFESGAYTVGEGLVQQQVCVILSDPIERTVINRLLSSSVTARNATGII